MTTLSVDGNVVSTRTGNPTNNKLDDYFTIGGNSGVEAGGSTDPANFEGSFNSFIDNVTFTVIPGPGSNAPDPAWLPFRGKFKRKPLTDESHIKINDWNDYVIHAVDGRITLRITLRINGQDYMDFTDDGTGLTPGRSQVKGATSGRFAIQLHPGLNDGKGSEIRFKDFQLTLNPEAEPGDVKAPATATKPE